MPELYDRVRQRNSKYVPQFIGSNFDTLKNVGDVLDARDKQNKQNIEDGLSTAINDEYAPGDEHIGLDIYNKLAEERDRIARTGEGFENSSAIVRNSVRDNIVNNRDRIEGLRNAAEYKKYEEELRKYGAEGVDLTPKDAEGRVFTGTKNADGTYNRFKGVVQKAAPINEEKEKMFNQLENSLNQENYKLDASNPDFLKSVITGGITSNDIVKKYLDPAFARYKQNNEKGTYAQEVAIMKRDHPELNQEQIDERIKTSLLNTGLERVNEYKKLDLQQLSSENLRAKYNAAGNENPPPNHYATTGTGLAVTNNSLANDTVEDESKIHYDLDSKNYYKLELVPTGGRGGSVLTRVPVENPEVLNTKLKQQFERDKKLMGSNFSFKNYEDYKESKIEANKNSQQITGSPTQIEGEIKANLSSKANAALATAPLYLGNGEKINLNQLAEVADVNPNDIEVEPVQSYEESPNQNIPGGFTEMRVRYKSGSKPDSNAPTSLLMPISNEQVAASAPIDYLFKNSLYKGEDVHTEENPYDIEAQFGIPSRNNKGEKVVYVTNTIHLPKSRQIKGSNPYRTKVIEMVVDEMTGNLKPSLDESGQPITQSIASWKQGMKSYMSKIYSGAVNSGLNAFGEKDIKERDIIE